MKITKITVKGLFGALDHEISLFNEGITFIHGPNGCGKTTVLSLVQAAVAGKYQLLLDTDFDYLELAFEDDSSVTITKIKWNRPQEPTVLGEESDEESDDFDLIISLVEKKAPPKSFSFREHQRKIVATTPAVPLHQLERNIPGLVRISQLHWRISGSERLYSRRDLIEKYCLIFGLPVVQSQPPWLQKYLEKCRIGFVKTQRLVRTQYPYKVSRGETEGPAEVIVLSSEALKERIEKQLADYAIHAQILDSTFALRLINSSQAKIPPDEEIRTRYRASQDVAQELMSAGLLEQADSVPLPIKKLTPTERRVLGLHLDDRSSKLSTFGDLKNRIEILLDIVGSKFSRKSLSIVRGEGFVINSTVGTRESLPLTALSSGEQHQVIVFFELLFSENPPNIYFIDEPEISLHVEWQRRFISDLERVKALTGASFLIATHSPQIINDRRDLAVALDGGVKL